MLIVLGYEFDDADRELMFVYGPFAEVRDAEAFVQDNPENLAGMNIRMMLKPPKTHAIHPNQAEIGDYIDPIVAN